MRANRKDSAPTHDGLGEFIVSLSRTCKFSEKQAKEAKKKNRPLSPEKQKGVFNKTGGDCHFCGDRLTLKLYGGRTRRDLNLAEQEEIFNKTGGLCHFCPTKLRLDGYVFGTNPSGGSLFAHAQCLMTCTCKNNLNR